MSRGKAGAGLQKIRVFRSPESEKKGSAELDRFNRSRESGVVPERGSAAFRGTGTRFAVPAGGDPAPPPRYHPHYQSKNFSKSLIS